MTFFFLTLTCLHWVQVLCTIFLVLKVHSFLLLFLNDFFPSRFLQVRPFSPPKASNASPPLSAPLARAESSSSLSSNTSLSAGNTPTVGRIIFFTAHLLENLPLSPLSKPLSELHFSLLTLMCCSILLFFLAFYPSFLFSQELLPSPAQGQISAPSLLMSF